MASSAISAAPFMLGQKHALAKKKRFAGSAATIAE